MVRDWFLKQDDLVDGILYTYTLEFFLFHVMHAYICTLEEECLVMVNVSSLYLFSSFMVISIFKYTKKKKRLKL